MVNGQRGWVNVNIKVNVNINSQRVMGNRSMLTSMVNVNPTFYPMPIYAGMYAYCYLSMSITGTLWNDERRVLLLGQYKCTKSQRTSRLAMLNVQHRQMFHFVL